MWRRLWRCYPDLKGHMEPCCWHLDLVHQPSNQVLMTAATGQGGTSVRSLWRILAARLARRRGYRGIIHFSSLARSLTSSGLPRLAEIRVLAAFCINFRILRAACAVSGLGPSAPRSASIVRMSKFRLLHSATAATRLWQKSFHTMPARGPNAAGRSCSGGPPQQPSLACRP